MRLRLQKLDLSFLRGTAEVEFEDFSYFYGEMGAGKSSIARLADYCLGGELVFTPALQAEFTSATLSLTVNEHRLELTRERESNRVRAKWSQNGGSFDVVMPARDADGEVFPGSGIENLSDLIFSLCDIDAPKVRRSKLNEESDLARLSLRDLLKFCYLDQDSMDASFFDLGAGSNQFVKLKNRDVIRYVVGFHQQRVSELEMALEEARIERLRYAEGAKALRDALAAANVGSEAEIDQRIAALQGELTSAEQEIGRLRSQPAGTPVHATDDLRERARRLSSEMAACESAISSLSKVVPEETRHLNEVRTLSVKADRALTAHNMLAMVPFKTCPRCSQTLPTRESAHCVLCDLPDPIRSEPIAAVDGDIRARIAELEETISLREKQLFALRRRLEDIRSLKIATDKELNEASRLYDSAYLSTALVMERRRAAVAQDIASLERLRQLPRRVEEQLRLADAAQLRETSLRRDLLTAQSAAEKDARNLRRLEELFLDCLVRAGIPGIERSDVVEIHSPDFLPVIYPRGGENVVATSFSNLGSGGKKTLFKCCFALALHRLATEIGAVLPTLLIIDSPMKNISERENRKQFEGFHELLYALAGGELRSTQFVLIDKEWCSPKKPVEFDIVLRHMTPADSESPPLIPYYRGH